MGILDKSKRMYKVSGARMNSSPPRVIKVHLKSHINLENHLQGPSSLSSNSLESNLHKDVSEDSTMLTASNYSLSPILMESPIDPREKEVTDPIGGSSPDPIGGSSTDPIGGSSTLLQKDRIRKSFPGDISEKELAFRLAYPTAMRNMLIANRSISNKSEEASRSQEKGTNDSKIESERCRVSHLIHEDYVAFGRTSSLRSVTQTRRGSWCANSTIQDKNDISNQRVWPRGRFYSLAEKKPIPFYQNKVEVIWNDSYSQNKTFIKHETPSIASRTPVAQSARYRKKNPYYHNNAGQIRSVLGTPSPPKNKLTSVLSTCCLKSK